MNRLTDDNTAEKLREVSDKLKAGGFEVDVSNERYIKLAEYEQTGLTPGEIDILRRRASYLEEELDKYRETGLEPEDIEELTDKHWEECRQIALYDDEIRQYKYNLFTEFEHDRCGACFFRGLDKCRNLKNCQVSEILARIDGDRWLKETESVRDKYWNDDNES